MTLFDTLDLIRQGGGSVSIQAGAVRVRAPAGLLTPEHRGCLRDHKDLLLNLLGKPSSSSEGDEERAAIQWVEQLPEPEGEQVLAQAIKEWDELIALPLTPADAEVEAALTHWFDEGELPLGWVFVSPDGTASRTWESCEQGQLSEQSRRGPHDGAHGDARAGLRTKRAKRTKSATASLFT